MTNKWRNAVLVLLTCIVVLAGCSPEKKPSTENFKKAIAEWNQQNGGYMLGTNIMPLSLPAVNTPKLYVRNFAMLSRAGLVSVVLEPATAADKSQQQYKYTLTELGTKQYTPGKGFKVSVPEAIEIEKTTEKTGDAKSGAKTYFVQYKYKEVPTELGKTIYKDPKEALTTGTGVLQLDLTDSGWKARSLGN